jgi:N-acetyl-gamma-glutamyl-phosphate reductase
MSLRVFIDGAHGTTGLEIRERLEGRSDVTLVTLPPERRRDPAAREDALNAADIVILCLPDDAAREAVALVANGATRIIDASTAFRTASGWTYGFAELEPSRRAELAAAPRVANPGCYPTAFLALVRPLVREGLLPADYPVSVNAVSGYSGGGKAMIAAFEDALDHDATETAFRLYALGLGHKHVPEMQSHAGLLRAPIFMPSVARTYRGMVAEVPLHLDLLGAAPLARLGELLADSYAGQPLVRVVAPDERVVPIERCAGTDRLELMVLGDERAGQARLVATLDNLGKGAAGAAVQNLNLMAGLPEIEGLRA